MAVALEFIDFIVRIHAIRKNTRAAAGRLPGRVDVIVDESGQCARLGYGEFDGVTLLHEHGVVSGSKTAFASAFSPSTTSIRLQPAAASGQRTSAK
jgi:hypothetical protein